MCCVEENEREEEGEGEHDEDERGILVVEAEGEERYGRRELETRCDCIRGGIVDKCKVDGRPAHERYQRKKNVLLGANARVYGKSSMDEVVRWQSSC